MDSILLDMRDEPYLVPIFVVGSALAVVVFCVLRRRGKTPSVLTLLFMIAFIGFLAVTLTPSRSSNFSSTAHGYCAFDAKGLLPGRALLSHSGTRMLNVLIAVPMGFLAVLRRGRSRAYQVAAVVIAPLAVEGAQWILPQLGRSCSSMDAGDNLTGVVVGLLGGVVVAAVLRGITKGGRATNSDGVRDGAARVI